MNTILQIIPSRTWGGGEVFVCNLSEALIREKECAVVFVGRKSDIVGSRLGVLGEYRSLPFVSMFDIYTACNIAKIVRERNVNVIHAHIFQDAFLAVLAKKMFGLKDLRIVMTRHLVRKGKFSPLYRWLYRNIDCMIFVSNMAKDFFLSSAKVDTSDIKITVLHNSVPDRSFVHSSIREKYHIPQSTTIVGYSGRIADEKGIDTIIETAELLKGRDVMFLLAGTGEKSYVNHIESMIKDRCLEERVRLVGFVDEVYDFVSQVDMALLPSVGREGFCLSVLEYMRYRKPVITTDNGAQSEIITDGKNGFLIPVGDARAAADRIAALIGDGELSKLIGDAAGERAKYFSYNRFLDSMSGILLGSIGTSNK